MLKRYIVFPFLIIVLLIAGCSEDQTTLEDKTGLVPENVTNEFGLAADSLTEVRGTIKRNQTLTDILIPFNVSYKTIYKISQASEDVFDITKMKSGRDYTIYLQPDTVDRVKYFVYEDSPIRYYVFDLSDTVIVTYGEKEVEIREAELTGKIHSSLYETLESLGASPLLALKLSEVFAWQIDFYGVQPGDYFKVIYNQKYLDGKFMTVGKIKAALFSHMGAQHYGFYFDDGGNPDYFDQEGNSLRKAFLKAPLKFGRISSRYSSRRFHPVLKIYRPHRGIDYAAPTGTPIQAIGDGVVLNAGYKGGNGNWVKIRHNSTYQSAYLHMSRFAKGIRSGRKIRQGQVIGYVGSTGLATGPHLDFRFYKNGTPVNYLIQEFPPSRPVAKELQDEYWNVMSGLKERLDSLTLGSEVDQLAAGAEGSKQ